MSANVTFISSILDRMEQEQERTDRGVPPAPADRSFVHLVQDVARLDWDADYPEIVRQIESRARLASPKDIP